MQYRETSVTAASPALAGDDVRASPATPYAAPDPAVVAPDAHAHPAAVRPVVIVVAAIIREAEAQKIRGPNPPATTVPAAAMLSATAVPTAALAASITLRLGGTRRHGEGANDQSAIAITFVIFDIDEPSMPPP